MLLKDNLKTSILAMGADAFGVANVERFAAAPRGFHPSDILPGTQSVIVFGKQFTKSVFRIESYAPYMLARERLVRLIDGISVQVSEELEGEGYRAVPIPSAEPYEYWDAENRHGRGILSLKHAAELAGLGAIGKSTLLISPAFGNRLWLGAILTDMTLEPDELTGPLCPEGCHICLDGCPAQALDGMTIVQKNCREVSFTSTDGGGALYSCNLCRRECPYCLA